MKRFKFEVTEMKTYYVYVDAEDIVDANDFVRELNDNVDKEIVINNIEYNCIDIQNH